MSRVPIRRASQSGKKRRFAECQITQVFVEISLCRLREAVNREGAALPQINVVAIQREYLFFREPRLENYCHRSLLQLSREGALGSQEVILDELLGQGRTALCKFALADVGLHRAKNSTEINSVMAEEAAILCGHYGISQVFGNIGKLNRYLFATVTFAYGCQQLTVYHRRWQSSAARAHQ